MKMLQATLAAALGMGIGIAVLTPSQAIAACPTNTYTNVDNIGTHLKAEPDQPLSNATAKITAAGAEVSTPDGPAKVYTYFAVSNIKLSDITKLSYWTERLKPSTGVVLPSYQLVIDYNGSADGGYSTLVYEPYQNGYNTPANTGETWDAYNHGIGKWWSSKLDGYAPQSDPKKFSDIVAEFPDAVVTAYGLDQGSGNAGVTSIWNNLIFQTTQSCAKQTWALFSTPSPSVSKSTSPSATASTSTNPTVATTLASGGGGSLPTTGFSTMLAVYTGLVLLGGGIFLTFWMRRRHTETRFTAGDEE